MYHQVGIFSLDSSRSILKIGKKIVDLFLRLHRKKLFTWDIVWIRSEKLGLGFFELVSIISRRFSRHHGALFAAWTEIRTDSDFSKNHFFDDVLEFFIAIQTPRTKIRTFAKVRICLNKSALYLNKSAFLLNTFFA